VRINWAEEIKNGKGRYKIVDEMVQILKTGNIVVVEDTSRGTFTMTQKMWEKGGIIEGEPLVVLDEVAL
jgi:bifunctional ADP-heptose synthase (sugar kinase/adenylyltransferase)